MLLMQSMTTLFSNYGVAKKEIISHPIPPKDQRLLHDLKNALFVIQATAELTLNQDLQPGEVDELSERIYLAVNKAVDLADDLSRV